MAEPILENLDPKAIDVEVAKSLLADASKMLEAQQRTLDSLRARLMDVARQAITLATVAFGTAASVLSSHVGWASPEFAAGAVVAGLAWVLAAIGSTVSFLPTDWALAGRNPHDWWQSSLLYKGASEANGAVAPLMSMARSSGYGIEVNAARQEEAAKRLTYAVRIHILAAPLGLMVFLMASQMFVWAAAIAFIGLSTFLLRDMLR